ncbi:MAG: tetratricopeptide repeat protein [Phycisphaerae bacterium]|nr:tetratricopeptide repeat protein [Phycisphaerae bacterium]
MNKQQCYRLGMSAYHAGRYEKTIELLSPLVVPRNEAQDLLIRYYLGQAHYHLAVRLFKKQRYGEATHHFQAAAGLNSAGGGFARFLVACHVGCEQYDLAVRELENMLQHDPDDITLRVRLALARYKQGSQLEAMATLREGLVRQPDQAELHYQLGVMLAADEDWIDAERSLEMAIAYEPAHAGAHERLAQLCAVRGRHQRAVQYLEAAHALDPLNARIAFQLSLLAQSQMAGGRWREVAWQTPVSIAQLDDASLDQLGKAIVAEPDFVAAFLSLPESEVDGEVFSTLAATLERVLQEHPEFADLHYHCGEVYRRLDQRLNAIAHAEQAVQLNPRYVKALVLLAELYGQTEQWAMGVERLEQAVRAGANYPDVHYLMGRLFHAGGKWDQAWASFERALDLNEDYQAAREAMEALQK